VSFGAPQALDRLFPETAELQTGEQSFDEQGTETITYTTLASEVAVQLSTEASVSLVQTGDGSFEVRGRKAILYGWWPELDERSRIIVDGHTYHVRGVSPDSWGIALADKGWTVLVVEERNVVEGSS
jgi:hypothetical protein